MLSPVAQGASSTQHPSLASAGRVAVALSGTSMLQQAQATLPLCTFVEFRLDSLPDPAGFIPQLQAFLAEHSDVTAIATCRRAAFGGGFNGTALEQLHVLQAAAHAGCRLVDAEVETAEELGPELVTALHQAGAALMLSWHDFSSTPPLEPVFERIAAHSPDLIKIVPTAKNLHDSLRLIDLLERHNDGRLVAMSMGQPGVLTRILGPRFGSAFTFAAPDGSEGTAPGQVGIHDVLHLYRIENITATTTVYAVAGSPIGASLSPRMHNAALEVARLDAVYLPLETDDPQELLLVADRLEIRGLSVTMPLKETILPLLDVQDAEVLAMGACNTVLRESDASLHGFNTDVAGIVAPLQMRMGLHGKRVLVLGAGGAARAAVFGLRERGADVFLVNRTGARAAALAKEADARVLQREQLASEHFDIGIHSTPYGMRGKEIEPPIEPEEMNCSLFFDLVYNPLETPLMRMAKQRGIPTIAGAEMFVAQGVRQFELWTGRDAPQSEMLRVVAKALSQ